MTGTDPSLGGSETGREGEHRSLSGAQAATGSEEKTGSVRPDPPTS